MFRNYFGATNHFWRQYWHKSWCTFKENHLFHKKQPLVYVNLTSNVWFWIDLLVSHETGNYSLQLKWQFTRKAFFSLQYQGYNDTNSYKESIRKLEHTGLELLNHKERPGGPGGEVKTLENQGDHSSSQWTSISREISLSNRNLTYQSRKWMSLRGIWKNICLSGSKSSAMNSFQLGFTAQNGPSLSEGHWWAHQKPKKIMRCRSCSI